ncbi:MAG: hypothetical protein Q7S72_01310, partial [Candidatus Taylorbacteria bacterium]|nr:hypothetical protein [Candidatus Taylorbacteria bacterium]
MKKILIYILILTTLAGISIPMSAQETAKPICYDTDKKAIPCPTTYVLLAPLPCEKGTPGCNESGELTTYTPSTTNP